MKKDVAMRATDFFVNMNVSLHVNPETGQVMEYESVDGVLKEVPLKLGTENHKVEVYTPRDPLPQGNYWVYNPFSGNVNDTAVDRYMYKYIAAYVASVIKRVINDIIYLGLEQKKESTGDLSLKTGMTLNKKLINILSSKTEDKRTIVDSIDLKCFSEFEAYLTYLYKSGKKLLDVIYNQKTSSSALNIPLLSPHFMVDDFPQIPNVRKKSFYVIRAILKAILGDDMENYKVVSVPDVPVKFFTVMRVYYLIFYQLSNFVNNEGIIPHLDEYQEHLDNLPQYKNIMKFINVAAPDIKPVATTNTNNMLNTVPANGVNNVVQNTNKPTMLSLSGFPETMRPMNQFTPMVPMVPNHQGNLTPTGFGLNLNQQHNPFPMNNGNNSWGNPTINFSQARLRLNI